MLRPHRPILPRLFLAVGLLVAGAFSPISLYAADVDAEFAAWLDGVRVEARQRGISENIIQMAMRI